MRSRRRRKRKRNSSVPTSAPAARHRNRGPSAGVTSLAAPSLGVLRRAQDSMPLARPAQFARSMFGSCCEEQEAREQAAYNQYRAAVRVSEAKLLHKQQVQDEAALALRGGDNGVVRPRVGGRVGGSGALPGAAGRRRPSSRFLLPLGSRRAGGAFELRQPLPLQH